MDKCYVPFKVRIILLSNYFLQLTAVSSILTKAVQIQISPATECIAIAHDIFIVQYVLFVPEDK